MSDMSEAIHSARQHAQHPTSALVRALGPLPTAALARRTLVRRIEVGWDQAQQRERQQLPDATQRDQRRQIVEVAARDTQRFRQPRAQGAARERARVEEAHERGKQRRLDSFWTNAADGEEHDK